MGRKPKYQSKPTFHWQPEEMIQDITEVESGRVIEIGNLSEYFRCADMSNGQVEEAITKLKEALKEIQK